LTTLARTWKKPKSALDRKKGKSRAVIITLEKLSEHVDDARKKGENESSAKCNGFTS